MSRDIIFKNRKEAGTFLARHLEAYKNDPHVVVMGVPKGGVEVAFYVSAYLNVSLCVIISKKLVFPGIREFSFGALAEDGSLHIPPDVNRYLGDHLLNEIIAEQKKEVERRVELYRKGGSLPCLNELTVIVVDDGIDTGVTLVPVIKLCRNKGAQKVIIATPVASPRYDWKLDEADELIFAQQPVLFSEVGKFYEDFPDTSDEDVIRFLNENKCSLNKLPGSQK